MRERDLHAERHAAEQHRVAKESLMREEAQRSAHLRGQVDGLQRKVSEATAASELEQQRCQALERRCQTQIQTMAQDSAARVLSVQSEAAMWKQELDVAERSSQEKLTEANSLRKALAD